MCDRFLLEDVSHGLGLGLLAIANVVGQVVAALTGNDDISDDDAREQAYGVVVAASGVFYFKSNKLLRDGKNSISPANMLLGGCCAKEFKSPAAVATLDNSNGKLIAIHSGDVLNSFFLDGSVTSLEADAFKGKSFYVPKSDGSSAEKFSGGILQDK